MPVQQENFAQLCRFHAQLSKNVTISAGYERSFTCVAAPAGFFSLAISAPDFLETLATNPTTQSDKKEHADMRLVLIAVLTAVASAPAVAQEISIAAQGGKSPTASQAAHCVAYYRTEAKLRRPPNAPFEETMRGEAWKAYLQATPQGAAANALIAEAETEVAAALAKSRNTWRDPYEEPCGAYEKVRLP